MTFIDLSYKYYRVEFEFNFFKYIEELVFMTRNLLKYLINNHNYIH